MSLAGGGKTVHGPVHVPAIRHALQLVLARVREGQPRADDEVLDGARPECSIVSPGMSRGRGAARGDREQVGHDVIE